MKKIFSYVTPEMRHSIFYQWVTKCVAALALLLLWDRFIKPLRLVRDGFFIAAVCFLLMAWFSYLWFDGMRLPQIIHKEKKKKTRNRTRDIVDFADEHIVSIDELSDEERHACGFCSSLLAAMIFFVPSLVALFLK